MNALSELATRADRTTVRQLATFGAIGLVSTLAYVAVYALLRTVSPPAVANFASLLVTAVGNTAANRHLTFGVRGRDGIGRDQVAGLVAFGVALAITTGGLGVLHLLAPGAGRGVEVVVLVAANALATVARFVLLRTALTRTAARQVALPEVTRGVAHHSVAERPAS